MQTINMLPTTKRFKVKVVRQQTVRQKCVESLRWYCSEHSEAVLACPLAKVCIYQHFMILWSLLKALNQSLGVIIPSTLLTQQRAHLQPNGISRQMGRGGRFCREANQKGTVWCSLTDCKACGLVYCLFKLLASEARMGKKGTSKVSWLAQSLVGNLPKAGLKKKKQQQRKISCGQHKQVFPESHADTFNLLGTSHRAALFHMALYFATILYGFSQAMQEAVQRAELMQLHQSCLK